MGITLVFGTSGFFGPFILKQNPDFVSIGRTAPYNNGWMRLTNPHINLNNLNSLEGVLKHKKLSPIDNVIFLIGNSNHHLLNGNNLMAINYNVLPLKTALHFFKDRGLKKFIAFTGALLYDVNKITLPVDEDQPLNPYVNEYIFSKYLAEEVTKLYPSVPVINVRLSNIYGPTLLIRPDLVPSLFHEAIFSNNPRVWNMTPERDFIYAEDAARAVVKLLDTDYTGPINLGSGEMHSVAEVVDIIEKNCCKKQKFINLDRPVTGPMRFCYDIRRIQQLTGWQPEHSLEEGLKKTYEAYIENFFGKGAQRLQ